MWMKPILILAVGVFALHAQSTLANAEAKPAPPTSTKVRAHILGETVQEWLRLNQMDLTAICASKRRQDKSICKNLSAYSDGNTGSFSTVDEHKNSYEWIFTDGKVAEVKTGTALDFYAGGTHFSPSTMQEQIGFLSQVYGPPTKIETVPYQNSLGAKWDCTEATWNMPDGAAIVAVEDISNVGEGPARSLTVRFISKGRVSELQRTKPNPYVH